MLVEQEGDEKVTGDRNYKWLVHINEGFGIQVEAPNVEGALMKAFAEYWLKHKNPSLLTFDIQVLNLTEYEAAKIGGKTTT